MFYAKTSTRYICFFLCYVFILLFISCQKTSIDNLYYHSSTKRFNIDYSEKVEEAINFTKVFNKSYKENLQKSFPNFNTWDSLQFPDLLKVNTTLYISAEDEILLNFTKEGPIQFSVKATQYPLQFALIYGLDVFPPYLKPINTQQIIDTSKTMIHFMGLSDSSTITYTNGNLTNVIPVSFQKHGFAVFINTKLSAEDNPPAFLELAFLTTSNGFEDYKDSASFFAKDYVLASVQEAFFRSFYFKEALVNYYLKPVAQNMINKYDRKKKQLGNYPYEDYIKDMDSLYRIAKKLGFDKEYVDGFYDFTSEGQTDILHIYNNENDLFLKWCIINFIILIMVVSFKAWIERKFETVNWLAGIMLCTNCGLVFYYWNVMNLLLLLFAASIGITSSILLAYSNQTKKFRF